MLVELCIVGQCHDNDSNNSKMRRALTWCSEEVKWLNDICADEYISLMLDTAGRNSEDSKIMNE